MMRKHFNKKLVMTKEDDVNEVFDNSAKCWICDKVYVDGDIKVKDHCHITEKYRGSLHRDCNINIKLNHKIPVIFHKLKTYECVSGFGMFNEELSSTEKFYSLLTDNKISDKDHKHVLKVWNKFEMKTVKDYDHMNLKRDVLL